MKRALFDKAVVTIYDSPSFIKVEDGIEKSTISDEGLYGHELKAGEVTDGFVEITTDYNYNGYVREEDILYIDREPEYRKMFVRAFFTDVLNIPHVDGVCHITLTKGAIVRVTDYEENGYVKVVLGDGKEGFTPISALTPYIAPMSPTDVCEEEFRQAIVRTAKEYMGVQYRWGGKSPLGIDCSGLTSMSYMLNGVYIYRDAKIKEGFPVKETSRDKIKPGDLIYFPGHIAMYIGNDEYIHSTAKTGSDGVVINSLNPDSEIYRDDLPGKIKAFGTIFGQE